MLAPRQNFTQVDCPHVRTRCLPAPQTYSKYRKVQPIHDQFQNDGRWAWRGHSQAAPADLRAHALADIEQSAR